jgi:transposase
VTQTTAAFGCSRPTFYQAQAAFKAQGFPGLLPHKRGPHGAHKLDDAVMAFVQARRAEDPTLSTAAMLDHIRRRFGRTVHRRTLERAFQRAEKKRR